MIFGALGALYYLWLNLTGIGIPCPFKSVTGFLCPGCGVTKMSEAALRFNFKEAFLCNGAVLCLLPLLTAVYGVETVRYVRSGDASFCRASSVIVWVSLIILLIFGIVRNLP